MIDAAVLENILQNKLRRNTKVKQKGELCFSSCPSCGDGDDRFWVNPSTESFWCRHCAYSGWIIDLLVNDFQMPKDEALKVCGKHLEDNHQLYIYRDENGKPMFEVHAIRKPGEPKKVWQRLPGSVKGTIRPELRVLFNMGAAMKSRRVYVVEGEKKVEILRKCGMTATTNPMGAGKFGVCSHDSLVKVFKGKDVVIIPDNDDPGKAHALDVADRLKGLARVIRVCHLPDLEEGEGLDDFIMKYGDERFKTAIISLIETTQPHTENRHYMNLIEFSSMDDVPPEPVVQGILEQGEACLIAAEYGQMKSLFRLQLALHIASGRSFLGRRIPKARTVGIFQWENSDYLERKRVKHMLAGLGIKMEAVAESIRYANRSERFNLILPEDRSLFIQRCEEINADILMFDNLSNMHTADENDNIKMRAIVDILSDINAKLNRSCVLIHHMSKPTEKRALRHRIRGAISLQDWASNIITIAPINTEDGRIVKHLGFAKVRDPDESFQPDVYVEFDKDKWCFSVTTVKMSVDGMVKLVYDRGGFASIGHLVDFIQKDYKMSRREANQMIDMALEEGRLIKVRGERNTKKIQVSSMAAMIIEAGKNDQQEEDDGFPF